MVKMHPSDENEAIITSVVERENDTLQEMQQQRETIKKISYFFTIGREDFSKKSPFVRGRDRN